MLKLLLDEHISPQVAKGLRRQSSTGAIYCLADWQEGSFLGQDDSACLRAAAAQRLTLVTYDLRTIPPLLKAWAEESRSHGGAIFVDEKTISPADIGGLVRALGQLLEEAGRLDWTDRICFLHAG